MFSRVFKVSSQICCFYFPTTAFYSFQIAIFSAIISLALAQGPSYAPAPPAPAFEPYGYQYGVKVNIISQHFSKINP